MKQGTVCSDTEVAPMEAIRIRGRETLFKSFAIDRSSGQYCRVVFTPTHFAWAVLPGPLWLASSVGTFRWPRVFNAVRWSDIIATEFEVDRDCDKLVRVLWTPPDGAKNILELVHVVWLDVWINAFRRCGFALTASNPSHLALVGRFLSEYGLPLWIMLGFGAFLYMIIERVNVTTLLCSMGIFCAITPLLGVSLHGIANRWFPPGMPIRLERSTGERTKDERQHGVAPI
jgi:hypothetical protein